MRDAFDPISSLSRLESLLQAGQKGVHFMSRFVILMIAGWAATIAMIGCFALIESGMLLKIRKRIASWRETSTAAVEVVASGDGLESAEEDVA
jgi:hypothetical protein